MVGHRNTETTNDQRPKDASMVRALRQARCAAPPAPAAQMSGLLNHTLRSDHLTKAGARLWITGRATVSEAKEYCADNQLIAQDAKDVLLGRRVAEMVKATSVRDMAQALSRMEWPEKLRLVYADSPNVVTLHGYECRSVAFGEVAISKDGVVVATAARHAGPRTWTMFGPDGVRMGEGFDDLTAITEYLRDGN